MTTIFAPITALSKAGVAVIRISGDQSLQCLKTLGCKQTITNNKIFFSKIYDPITQDLVDEVLISFFQSPNSFTGEDVVEISCHGSPFIVKKICKILLNQPQVRFAQNGEFSKRAFLNGKIDLVQAESIPDLIACETEIQHRQALNQLSGKLGIIYDNWRESIIELVALIQANIDFPEDDIPPSTIEIIDFKIKKLKQEISDHLNDNKIGHKIKDGLNLAIIGAPNVGKSSLINNLTQSEIAIVSDIAGTTRDIIETHLDIKGIAVKIADTAGLRETTDIIEKEGIKRALKKAQHADIKIFLVEADNPKFNFEIIDANTIIAINKIDKITNFSLEDFIKNNQLQKFLPNIVAISLINNINTSQLIKTIENIIEKIIPFTIPASITQERYRLILQECLKNLENFSLEKNIEISAQDLWFASQDLAKITGKIDVENILDNIFSRFCIGK